MRRSSVLGSVVARAPTLQAGQAARLVSSSCGRLASRQSTSQPVRFTSVRGRTFSTSARSAKYTPSSTLTLGTAATAVGLTLGALYYYYDQANHILYAVEKDGSVKRYFLGVDGGGSHVQVSLIDHQQNVISSGTSGCTNFNSVGQEKASTHLLDAIRAALESGGVRADQVAGVCMSMSGVDRPADIALVRGWVQPLLTQARIDVYNDAVAALASGTNGRLFGLVVISGTGTITYGVNQAGTSSRAAGWGPLLGDKGGGYQIGYEVLNAVVRALDGRGPATMLVEAVFEALGITRGEQIIPWAYASVAWERYAQLAPLAAIAARKGDKVAERILEDQAQDIVVSIKAVLKSLGLEDQPFPLVLAGGNFTHTGSYLTALLKQKVAEQVPKASTCLPTLSPEYAAALLALNTHQQQSASPASSSAYAV